MKPLVTGLALAAVVAASVLASANQAAAQPGRGPPPNAYRGAPPRYAPPPRYSPPPRYAPAPRYYPPSYSGGGYYQGGSPYYGSPSYGYDYRPAYTPWRRGQYLPPAYRGSYISDYGRYGLRRPPSGYRWYSSNGDYVLAAVATGLILDLFLGSR